MPDDSGHKVFSIDGIQGPAALAKWRLFLCEMYFNLDVSADPSMQMRGCLASRTVADIGISRMQSVGQRHKRNRQQTLVDKKEVFCLVMPSAGKYEYRQRNRENKAGAGGFYVLNGSEPYEVDVADTSDNICLTVPSSLLRERVARIDDLCGHQMLVDQTITSTLRHLASRAIDATPEVSATSLQDLILTMAEMIFAPRQEECRFSYCEAVAHLLVQRIRAAIQSRLSDPAFDITEAAHLCKATPRQILHALKKEGSSFCRELMNARLVAAEEMLRRRRKMRSTTKDDFLDNMLLIR